MNAIYQDPLKENTIKRNLLLVKLSLVTIGVACAIIIIACDTVEPGLEAFFLLPLSFSVACMVLKRNIFDAKDSFGIFILYMLIILRYLVSPVLTALSGELVPGVSTSAVGLRYALVIMILELFAIVIAINIIWKPVLQNKSEKSVKKEFNITLVGLAVCIVLAALVLARGRLPNVFAHLSIGKEYSFVSTALDTYDMSVVLTMKAFVFIAIVAWTFKKYDETNLLSKKMIYLAIAIAAAVGNSMIYDATARVQMVMCAMSSLTVLLFCFGKKIERFLPLIAVLGFFFVWSLFSYGTLGVRDGENFFERADYAAELSRVAELYSNGISTEAHAFDMYDTITSQMSLDTYISELIKSNSIFSLPGFWVIGGLVGLIPSIQKLFNLTLYGNAFILPNAGLAMYSARWLFGWPLDIVFMVLIVWGIYFFFKKRKQSIDLADQYLYSYCEMICAFTLMNNVMIAVSLLSALPLLLFIVIKLNSLEISKNNMKVTIRMSRKK